MDHDGSDAPTPVHRGFRVEVSTERVTLPGGTRIDLDVVHHPGAAAVVPFADERDVLLIRQYRHAAGGTILEIPAGKIDPGEGPDETAARELEEEVGQRAGRVERLGWVWTTPGFCDEKIYLYAAFDLTPSTARPEDDEVIEVVRTPLAEALAMIWRGELCDAKSAMGLIHAARRFGELA
jgi:ADP-ribose pyrophosphatase